MPHPQLKRPVETARPSPHAGVGRSEAARLIPRPVDTALLKPPFLELDPTRVLQPGGRSLCRVLLVQPGSINPHRVAGRVHSPVGCMKGMVPGAARTKEMIRPCRSVASAEARTSIAAHHLLLRSHRPCGNSPCGNYRLPPMAVAPIISGCAPPSPRTRRRSRWLAARAGPAAPAPSAAAQQPQSAQPSHAPACLPLPALPDPAPAIRPPSSLLLLPLPSTSSSSACCRPCWRRGQPGLARPSPRTRRRSRWPIAVGESAVILLTPPLRRC